MRRLPHMQGVYRLRKLKPPPPRPPHKLVHRRRPQLAPQQFGRLPPNLNEPADIPRQPPLIPQRRALQLQRQVAIPVMKGMPAKKTVRNAPHLNPLRAPHRPAVLKLKRRPKVCRTKFGRDYRRLQQRRRRQNGPLRDLPLRPPDHKPKRNPPSVQKLVPVVAKRDYGSPQTRP